MRPFGTVAPLGCCIHGASATHHYLFTPSTAPCFLLLSPRRVQSTDVQIALETRYGSALLYDDTAVKNRSRRPLGLGVVVDGEYHSRIVFQSLMVDTKAETFAWMLEEFKDARGGVPDIFVQDADAAMTPAAERVYPGPNTKKRRCQWHLKQNIVKNLKKPLGNTFQVKPLFCT